MTGSSSKRRRHHEEEEHENHERWLVTYADMVTLLMVLFIVMFAMSQVDEKKFMALKSGLAAGFANSASVLPGSTTLLEQQGVEPLTPVAPDQRLENLTKLTSDQIDPESDTAAVERELRAMAESQRLRKAEAQVLKALAEKGLAGDVRTTIDERGLVISLISQHVVFQADSAVLSPRGEAVVDALAPALLALPEDLQISGHTNQVAVQPANFATDWDLSAARAVTVLRRLNELLGVPTQRLSLAAYGHTQPLMDPDTAGSQRVNKRVDIVVLAGSHQEESGAGDAAPADSGTHSDTGTDVAAEHATQDRDGDGSDTPAAAAGLLAEQNGAQP
ncbi:flagellar motor protein MotB [Nocardioides sp.]|uniref:OmpA/MotB family protein n=1 Tax=Nocardioides sp. TaxID=35761 RepID=UPI001A1DB596|nr:flagellar motor protein MotB [Nocardioides sp.]MBJ7358609.1 flagellar motor protein MotB [Nocardioides sp.]